MVEVTNSPGTMANDTTTGSTAWANPSYAISSNSEYATLNGGAGTLPYYLKANNFGFAIPSGSIISGIIVEIEKLKVSGSRQALDTEVKIIKNSTIGSTNKADTVNLWSLTKSYFSYGGEDDLWGETWTPDDINSENFGMVLNINPSAGGTAGGVFGVDHIRITVYYTEGTYTSILPAFRRST